LKRHIITRALEAWIGFLRWLPEKLRFSPFHAL
jgi:hypothetical protein